MNVWSQVSLYTAAVVAIALASGLLALLGRGSARRLELFLAASAGVVLGVVGLHLLPEAFEAGPRAGLALVAGYVFMLVIERFVLPHALHSPHAAELHEHCDPETEREHVRAEASSVGAFVGLGLHTLVDGLALGAAIAEGEPAPFVFLAIVGHKIPSAFALGSFFVRAGARPVAVGLASGSLGVAVGVGAAAFFLASALGGFDPRVVTPWAVAFSAGSFLHVAVTDLLPDLHRGGLQRGALLAALGLGLGAVVGLGLLLPE